MIKRKKCKTIIGLVGYRCCGKSRLRDILTIWNYPVFDTNSIKTGDPDANQIPLNEILRRYGKNKSYLLFLKNHLKKFRASCYGILFIDSLKTAMDIQVLRTMFPHDYIEAWYLHASFQTRLERYITRNPEIKKHKHKLQEHDAALERHGLWNLIKNSREIINMELSLKDINKQVKNAISRIK